MNKQVTHYLFAIMLLFIAGCREQNHSLPDLPAKQYAIGLSNYGPRPVESQAGRDAANWIAETLANIGAPVLRVPIGTIELPEIAVMGRKIRERYQATSTDGSIVASFGPAATAQSPALLIMAHYDSVPGSPGGADNAGSVGVLLSLAESLVQRPPKLAVILAFTAGEEIGLLGAYSLQQWSLSTGVPIGFAIALDLIGLDAPLTINGASQLIDETQLRNLAQAANAAGVSLSAPIPHRIVSRWWPQIERADHGPFTTAGVPAIHLYHRGNGDDLIDLAYHSEFDTAERLQANRLGEVGSLLRAIIAAGPLVPRSPDTRSDAGFWLPVGSNLVIPVLGLFVAAFSCIGLTGVALLYGRRRRPLSPHQVAGLTVAIAGFVFAVALAFFVEQFASSYSGVWAHQPLRATTACSALIIGVSGLCSCFVARRWGLRGERRFLYLTIALHLLLGVFTLIIGAIELSLLWLVPALLLALAPFARALAPLALLLATLPIWLLLRGSQLRELVFHGFFPRELPLTLWVAVVIGMWLPAAAWYFRSRFVDCRPGPLVSLLLPVALTLLTVTGVALWFTADAKCSAATMRQFNLGCELRR